MGSEWLEVSQLLVGDTVRLDNGDLLEDITEEQLHDIQSKYEEVEVLY